MPAETTPKNNDSTPLLSTQTSSDSKKRLTYMICGGTCIVVTLASLCLVALLSVILVLVVILQQPHSPKPFTIQILNFTDTTMGDLQNMTSVARDYPSTGVNSTVWVNETVVVYEVHGAQKQWWQYDLSPLMFRCIEDGVASWDLSANPLMVPRSNCTLQGRITYRSWFHMWRNEEWLSQPVPTIQASVRGARVVVVDDFLLDPCSQSSTELTLSTDVKIQVGNLVIAVKKCDGFVKRVVRAYRPLGGHQIVDVTSASADEALEEGPYEYHILPNRPGFLETSLHVPSMSLHQDYVHFDDVNLDCTVRARLYDHGIKSKTKSSGSRDAQFAFECDFSSMVTVFASYGWDAEWELANKMLVPPFVAMIGPVPVLISPRISLHFLAGSDSTVEGDEKKTQMQATFGGSAGVQSSFDSYLVDDRPHVTKHPLTFNKEFHASSSSGDPWRFFDFCNFDLKAGMSAVLEFHADEILFMNFGLQSFLKASYSIPEMPAVLPTLNESIALLRDPKECLRCSKEEHTNSRHSLTLSTDFTVEIGIKIWKYLELKSSYKEPVSSKDLIDECVDAPPVCAKKYRCNDPCGQWQEDHQSQYEYCKESVSYGCEKRKWGEKRSCDTGACMMCPKGKWNPQNVNGQCVCTDDCPVGCNTYVDYNRCHPLTGECCEGCKNCRDPHESSCRGEWYIGGKTCSSKKSVTQPLCSAVNCLTDTCTHCFCREQNSFAPYNLQLKPPNCQDLCCHEFEHEYCWIDVEEGKYVVQGFSVWTCNATAKEPWECR